MPLLFSLRVSVRKDANREGIRARQSEGSMAVQANRLQRASAPKSCRARTRSRPVIPAARRLGEGRVEDLTPAVLVCYSKKVASNPEWHADGYRSDLP